MTIFNSKLLTPPEGTILDFAAPLIRGHIDPLRQRPRELPAPRLIAGDFGVGRSGRGFAEAWRVRFTKKWRYLKIFLISKSRMKFINSNFNHFFKDIYRYFKIFIDIYRQIYIYIYIVSIKYNLLIFTISPLVKTLSPTKKSYAGHQRHHPERSTCFFFKRWEWKSSGKKCGYPHG